MPRRSVPAVQPPVPPGACAYCTGHVPLGGRYCSADCRVRHAWWGCRPPLVRPRLVDQLTPEQAVARQRAGAALSRLAETQVVA